MFCTSYLIFSACQEILHPGRENLVAVKLGSTLHARKKYVLHFANLALYLKLGMRLTKIWRVLSFKQEAYLKEFADTCTMLRKNSRTTFEKDTYKKMANSNFGKLIENVRSYLDCKICVSEQSCKRWISSPRFSSMKILSENFVIIFLSRAKIALNKPIASGFTILELSKRFMYSKYYEEIKPALGPSCQTLMSDTDSLMLSVQSREGGCIRKIKHIMDFSNYPTSHKLFSEQHKGELGRFKDEAGSDTIKKFCALRSKVHTFYTANDEKKDLTLHSKCKGVTKAYKKELTFNNFFGCLQSVNQIVVSQFHIRSKDHKLYTTKVQRVAFGSFDDKRFIFSCGYHSVPYGSCYISEDAISTSKSPCPMCIAEEMENNSCVKILAQ